MTPLLLLGVLVFVDGTLCGFRAAAGRNPRLFLFDYYAASMRRGAVGSLATVAVFLGVGLGLRALGGEALWDDLVQTGSHMLVIYGLFATLVLSALGLYLVGSFDFGVLASVLVLGPFTLVRPLVILAGGAWAAFHAQGVIAASFAILAAFTMAGFERMLDLGQPPWRGLEGDGRR